MRVLSFSVVIGGTKCNAACPFCVSRMTAPPRRALNPNWFAFKKAVQAALDAGAWGVMFTGKGEPTEYPDLITQYLRMLGTIGIHLGKVRRTIPNTIYSLFGKPQFDFLPFAFADLQTNGINIPQQRGLLKKWHRLGLSTVCISLAHWNDAENWSMMRHHTVKPMNIWQNVGILKDLGYLTRLNFTAMRRGVETIEDVEIVIALCRKYGVDQLTIRDVATPDDKDSRNPQVTQYVKDHRINLEPELREYMKEAGSPAVMLLSHGATVHYHHGISFSVNNCLTTSQNPDELRQLISWPDGALTPDWKYDLRLL